MIFSDKTDGLPQRPIIPIRTIVTSVVVVCVGLAVLLFYLASDGFTRGELKDLPESERRVLDQIRETGLLVREAAIPCTMEPHIICSVHWQSSTGKYAVTAISLRNAPFGLLEPYLDQFSSLKEIRAPYEKQSQVDAIQRRVPKLTVNSSTK